MQSTSSCGLFCRSITRVHHRWRCNQSRPRNVKWCEGINGSHNTENGSGWLWQVDASSISSSFILRVFHFILGDTTCLACLEAEASWLMTWNVKRSDSCERFVTFHEGNSVATGNPWLAFAGWSHIISPICWWIFLFSRIPVIPSPHETRSHIFSDVLRWSHMWDHSSGHGYWLLVIAMGLYIP